MSIAGAFCAQVVHVHDTWKLAQVLWAGGRIVLLFPMTFFFKKELLMLSDTNPTSNPLLIRPPC